jgi:protein-tyrosine phosphatase
MFRAVNLPAGIAGQLFLHSMPGRYEPYARTEAEILGKGINRVVCLAPIDEIRHKSAEYARAIEEGVLSYAHEHFAIPDYQAPDDPEAFLELARSVATHLRADEHILIHCGAGIGRTGMLAVCVLIVLGAREPEAHRTIAAAGSQPERPAQHVLIRWVAEHCN